MPARRGGTGRALSTTEAPGVSRDKRVRLKTVWRRIEFLEERVKEHQITSGYDQAEAFSLRWLLREAGYPEPPPRNG